MTLLVRDALVQQVIGSAIEVHRALGPGLLESVYDRCLAHEFGLRGISFARQVTVPLVYKQMKVECVYRADFIVEGRLLVETKAVDALLGVHVAQVMTYVRLLGFGQALLINFNVELLKDGLRSLLNTRESEEPPMSADDRPGRGPFP